MADFLLFMTTVNNHIQMLQPALIAISFFLVVTYSLAPTSSRFNFKRVASIKINYCMSESLKRRFDINIFFMDRIRLRIIEEKCMTQFPSRL